MLRAIELFQTNIENSQSFQAIYQYLNKGPAVLSCADDLLRAQFSFIVGALDSFIHDIVRISVVKLTLSGEHGANTISSYSISLADAVSFTNNAAGSVAYSVDKAVRRANSYKSFQSPEAISQALSSIGVKKIWKRLESYLGRPAESTKDTLKAIVERRNKIVHESDVDPTFSDGYRYTITKDMVLETEIFIEQLVNAIFEITKSDVTLLIKKPHDA